MSTRSASCSPTQAPRLSPCCAPPHGTRPRSPRHGTPSARHGLPTAHGLRRLHQLPHRPRAPPLRQHLLLRGRLRLRSGQRRPERPAHHDGRDAAAAHAHAPMRPLRRPLQRPLRRPPTRPRPLACRWPPPRAPSPPRQRGLLLLSYRALSATTYVAVVASHDVSHAPHLPPPSPPFGRNRARLLTKRHL